MAPDQTTGGDADTQAGNEPLISPEILKTLGLDFEPPSGDSNSDDNKQDSSGTDSQSSATEPDEALRAAARQAGEEEGYARARRELEEERARETEELKRSGEYQDFQRKYRDRISQLGKDDFAQRFLQADTVPAIQAILKEVQDEFNSHHADGLKLYRDEAVASVAKDYTDQLFEAIGLTLSKETQESLTQAHEARPPSERNWKTFVQDIVDAARKDTLTAAKANEIAQAAVAKVAKDEKWLRARLSQVSAPGSSSSSSSTPSDDDALIQRYARGEAVDTKLVQAALSRLSDAKIV